MGIIPGYASQEGPKVGYTLYMPPKEGPKVVYTLYMPPRRVLRWVFLRYMPPRRVLRWSILLIYASQEGPKVGYSSHICLPGGS